MRTSICPTPASRHGTPFFALVLGLLLALPAAVTADPPAGKGKGKAHGKSPDFAPPGLVNKAIPPGHRRAPLEIIVVKPPPPLRVETMPARPHAGHLWVAGYWHWESDAYVWVPGAWIAPPEPKAVWVPPRFEQRSGVSVYISGFWRL